MRRGAKSALIGKWRIIEMGLWDNDYLDMVEPAYIQFKATVRPARENHQPFSGLWKF